MSKIKGKDTKPEMIVRKFLHSKGLRYLLHPKNIQGRPDLYFPKYKTAVEVRGCFWHGHSNCRFFVLPKTNTEWWSAKIEKTIERDYRNEISLLSSGIRTLVVWECSLKKDKINDTLETLFNEITDANV